MTQQRGRLAASGDAARAAAMTALIVTLTWAISWVVCLSGSQPAPVSVVSIAYGLTWLASRLVEDMVDVHTQSCLSQQVTMGSTLLSQQQR